ncbi:MAG: radical SAM family heme chaperone HemW [Actinomycetota bacterium]|nr:radical SAM family heme chaperone HemW [Actinomycetota bacterium]
MNAEFGVYVHIPFCSHRCDYCAFATWTEKHHLIEQYMAALVTQARHEVALGMAPVTSVFVGGGTPSLVSADNLMAVIAELPVTADAEVTIECNPDSVDSAKLAVYREGGANRVSFGVQSMVPAVLAALGRTHNPDNVVAAVTAARAVGFESINLDVIYGGAGESLDDWRTTLDGIIVLEPDHVSAYGLTVEPGTVLYDDPSRHPDDDDQADKYLLADEILGAAGLLNYEISNWSKPGEECRHNLLYWSQGEYAGLGCAAHAHIDGRRFWSVRTPERYIDSIESSQGTEAGSERLDLAEREVEALQLAIRRREGVPVDVVPDEVIHLVDIDADGTARLNLQGRLLANEVAVRLTPRAL